MSPPGLHGDDPWNHWRVEEACREAWPAASEEVWGGWLLRRSGGRTRRINSANPLPGARQSGPHAISSIEKYYRDHGQVPTIRITDFASEPSAELDRRSYSTEGETRTIRARFDQQGDWPAEGVEVANEPRPEWLDLRDRLAGDPIIFREIVRAIRFPKAFAHTRASGRTVAIAYGVLVDGLLVIESVATHPDFRGRGLARRTVGRLLNWARQEGAVGACLQVLADNRPALAAYAALGFDIDLYSYRYRLAPDLR
jgi:GNAT superfamily N-acetyltransferase